MKIVADENIPFVKYYFGADGEINVKPGRDITQKDLVDADILLVRAVTAVNEKLLQGTKVKFVGSTTSGIDHLDTVWLDSAGIHWSAAEGCNAIAVMEYVMALVAALQKNNFLNQKKLRAGVVGVGKVGSKVVCMLETLGFEVMQCDPLRAEKETNFTSTSLEDFADLDLITLHTSLTQTGSYPTYHLIDKNFLIRQKKNCVLINTSRGEVINFDDLKRYGEELVWCLDVWENEPTIDFEVLDTAIIATPHIAGYSVQAKYRGIEMVHRAALAKHIVPKCTLAPIEFPTKTIMCSKQKVDWREVILKIYDPCQTTELMKKKLIEQVNAFDTLRKNFVERYEMKYVNLMNVDLSAADRKLLHFVASL